MVRFDTSNDKESKRIVDWCKKNNYQYSFELKDKERNMFTYPFNIEAPSDLQNKMKEIAKGLSI